MLRWGAVIAVAVLVCGCGGEGLQSGPILDGGDAGAAADVASDAAVDGSDIGAGAADVDVDAEGPDVATDAVAEDATDGGMADTADTGPSLCVDSEFSDLQGDHERGGFGFVLEAIDACRDTEEFPFQHMCYEAEFDTLGLEGECRGCFRDAANAIFETCEDACPREPGCGYCLATTSVIAEFEQCSGWEVPLPRGECSNLDDAGERFANRTSNFTGEFAAPCVGRDNLEACLDEVDNYTRPCGPCRRVWDECWITNCGDVCADADADTADLLAPECITCREEARCDEFYEICSGLEVPELD